MKLIKKFLILALALVMTVTSVTVYRGSTVQAAESSDYNIKVNLGTNCVTIYKNGKAVKSMICSPSDETPVGTFYTPVKYKWHLMIGNCYAQYCTRITGQVLFHSVWYYKEGDKSTMSVSSYNVMGNKASHGCVRLLCIDAKWIYDNCALGTRVDIFWGDADDDPLGRPGFTPITDGSFTNWDPTDPDPANPWNLAKPTITQLEKNIEYGSKVKVMDTVEIKDSAGNILTNENGKIKIEGKINTKKLGTYKVKITAKDALGNSRSTTLKYKVVDTKQPIIKGYRKRSGIAMGATANVKTNVKAYTAVGVDITKRIKISVRNDSNNRYLKVKNGSVTFRKAGTYTVRYMVKGNNGRTITRKVIYKVVDKRVVTQLTAKKVTLTAGERFRPLSYVQGITTYDGKNLKVRLRNVSVSGNVDTNTPGTYKVVYTISDGKTEFTSVTKKLTVVVKPKVEEPTTIEEETTSTEVETSTNIEEPTTTEVETSAQ